MVRGHDENGLLPAGGLDDPPEGHVHRPDGFQDGLPFLDMSDDVHIGQIGDDELASVSRKGLFDGVDDARRAHRGDRGVVPRLRGRDDHAFLAGKYRIALAVEEVADVNGLLGLRDLDHPEPGDRDRLDQGVLDMLLRREGDRDPQGPRVFDERDEVEVKAPDGKVPEVRVDEGLGQLDLPLAPDVVEDDGIAVR